MTKRFKNVEEKLDWGTIQYFTYNDKELTDDEIEDLVTQLLEENEQLKKRIDRIDIILDDLNGAEYISRDDAIKALNKIDKAVR